MSRDERYMHDLVRFSALQRAEIAEISHCEDFTLLNSINVSVLFNEPKLLKSET